MGCADVEHGLITRAQAENAEEIFLTSSWLGVMPCASVAGRALPQREFATRLLRDYRKQFNDRRE
jgi:branched-subunit amino acid aminotransferase/4-amino-4-deoxychorismate lyase